MDYLKISEDKVKMQTGRNWREWFGILDKWEAGDKGHKATARYLGEKYHLSGWWSQVIHPHILCLVTLGLFSW